MKRIIDNIEINYQSEAESFIDDLLEHLLNSRIEIYNFFGITPRNKIEITLVPTKQELDEIYKQNINDNPKEWVVGFTPIEDNTYQIYLLSYNDYKNTVHRYESFEKYKKTLVHEFVHIINIIFSSGVYPVNPIWEGVATYLSKQYEEPRKIISEEKDLLTGNCDFREYHAIFCLLVNKYSHEDILKILNTTIDGSYAIKEILQEQNHTNGLSK